MKALVYPTSTALPHLTACPASPADEDVEFGGEVGSEGSEDDEEELPAAPAAAPGKRKQPEAQQPPKAAKQPEAQQPAKAAKQQRQAAGAKEQQGAAARQQRQRQQQRQQQHESGEDGESEEESEGARQPSKRQKGPGGKANGFYAAAPEGTTFSAQVRAGRCLEAWVVGGWE